MPDQREEKPNRRRRRRRRRRRGKTYKQEWQQKEAPHKHQHRHVTPEHHPEVLSDGGGAVHIHESRHLRHAQ